MSTNSPYSTVPGQQPAPPASNNTTKIVLIILGVLFLAFLLCGGVMVALLLPAVNAARQAALQMNTQNNVKQVGLAVHNYHDVYQQLPPLYATDANGNPVSSWRVSLLPFLEERALDEQWQAGQAWDSPANQSLLEQTPAAYRGLGESPTGPHDGQCHLFVIDDPSALLSGDEPRHFRDVLDGTSNTLFALYLPNRSVPWSAPQELSLDEAFAEVSAASPEAPVMALMLDGSVRRLTTPLSRETFEAMVTPAGGERVFDF
ncbi:DUF1559 family PulG-like putative transporter [Roseimaritima ulvae]|uniref:DUF1559 domain-containing protein n=1 Tax=Roseimaritima ulvae TaxID=980254 RepID=A0A5B9QT32_9BACT|nr:DUF1559 domain-containing protein [Roseimaritima ulvae]QEG41099.1 hypothetical protein UC8_31170 [Roseimaritima ulvae]